MNFADLSSQLNALYAVDCCKMTDDSSKTPVNSHLSSVNLSTNDDLLNSLLNMVKRVYNEKGMPPGIDKKVTKYYADQLWTGVTEGYGQDLVTVDYDTPDAAMLENLQTNVYQFSAAKNYNQLKSLTEALIGEDGKVRSFKDFQHAAMQINDQHVKQWLKAEYDMAIGSSQAAAGWVRIEADAEILPLLEFDAVMDGHTTEICSNLNGVVRPINDGFWDLYYIPNHWGERSIIRQKAKGTVTDLSQVQTPEKMPAMFKTNLAKNGLLFPPGHAYYTDLPKNILKQGEMLIPKK